MKKVIVLAVVCMAIPCAKDAMAALVSDTSITEAQSAYNTAQKRFEAGVVSQFEVRMSERNLLQLKLANRPNDYVSFNALAVNTVERFKLVTANFDAGQVTQITMFMMEAEKQMLSQACTSIMLKTVKHYYLVGMASEADVNGITKSCELLRK